MSTKDKGKNKPQKNLYLGKGDSGLTEFDLIEVQRQSWEKLLTQNLKDILNEFFPIEDYTGKKFTLFFEDVYFGEPRYTLYLCLQNNLTYDTPVYLKLKL
jgi:DNA-directed RNA polymerase subunit beta